MSLLQSTFALCYVMLFVTSLCSFTYAATPGDTDVTEAPKEKGFFHYIMQAFLERVDLNEIEGGEKTGRVKRQSGAGRFSAAAKMPATKILQLYLSMFRNLFTTDRIGGVHPMSPENAEPVVRLFKQRIITFFIPDKV